jgi:hypothetical protein
MTKNPEIFAALAAPFGQGEVGSRSLSGRQIHYITARVAMNRLDNVFGPEGWYDRYRPGGDNSVVCTLTVRLPDGTELTKEDAGGAAGMADAGDDDKSAHSDAFKRACVKFGVARYLYRDGVPDFAKSQFHGADAAAAVPAQRDGGGYQGGGGQGGYQGGGAARGGATQSRPQGNGGHGGGQGGGGGDHQGPPRSGKALFAWCKRVEEEYQVGIVKYLNEFIKLREFPGRMVDLDPEQVRVCYEEATRKLQSVGAGGREPGTEG